MKKYFTLCVLENGKYTPQFGDYSKAVVKQEIEDSYSDCKCVIIVTTNGQQEINAKVNDLNNEKVKGENIMEISNFICPQCKVESSIYSNNYQVNDINELTFCSYECSHQNNMDNKEQLLSEGYTLQDLKDLA